MQQPGIFLFWLPAIVAGGVALLAVLFGSVFHQRRLNRVAGDRQALLDEIATLQAAVLDLRSVQNNNAVQLEDLEAALAADAAAVAAGEEALPAAGGAPCALAASSRFPLLVQVDCRHAAAAKEALPAPQPTLQVLAEHLRRHAAAHCGIYAPRMVYGSFLAAMAVSDFLLLRAEEGAAAALPNAIAQALGQPLALTTVQPSWHSPADLLGQCRSTTKLYEETHFLRLLYEAGGRKGISLLALQPLLAAPPEKYLAQLLPLLGLRAAQGEAAGIARRALPLVDSAWPNDPQRLQDGNLPWPEGLWLLGLLAAEDPPPPAALRQRAIEFHIPPLNAKPFLVPWTQPLPVEAAHLREMFANAAEIYKLQQGMRSRFDALQEYLAVQMQCSLGAQAEAWLEHYAAVCLACGMSSREAMDTFLWHHALRQLETLEPAAQRHYLPGLRDFMAKTFEKRSIPLASQMLEARC